MVCIIICDTSYAVCTYEIYRLATLLCTNLLLLCNVFLDMFCLSSSAQCELSCCRIYLAILHYNENADRPQARRLDDGELQWKVVFPKAKKGQEVVVKPVKEKLTYGKPAKFTQRQTIQMFVSVLWVQDCKYTTRHGSALLQ